VDAARGTPENPVGADEGRARFRHLSAGVGPPARADAIRRAVEAIDRAPTRARLAAPLRAPIRARRRP
jgi:hypothetical protein